MSDFTLFPGPIAAYVVVQLVLFSLFQAVCHALPPAPKTEGTSSIRVNVGHTD